MKKQITIVVAEDSKSQRELMTQILRKNEFRVIPARHGEDALAKIMQHNPDLLLLDIVMPKINGYDVCRTLRRHQFYRHLPIIFCSSQESDLDRYWGLKQGADVYLAKPFKPEELLMAIAHLLPNNS